MNDIPGCILRSVRRVSSLIVTVRKCKHAAVQVRQFLLPRASFHYFSKILWVEDQDLTISIFMKACRCEKIIPRHVQTSPAVDSYKLLCWRLLLGAVWLAYRCLRTTIHARRYDTAILRGVSLISFSRASQASVIWHPEGPRTVLMRMLFAEDGAKPGNKTMAGVA